MIALPNEYLSVSQVEMYLRCPRQYDFRYIQGIVKPPAVALVEGSSHHEALEMNNANKIVEHEDLPEKMVIEKFCDTFSDKSKEIEDWEDETPDTVIERGKGLLNTYMTETAPDIQPLEVERRFDLSLDVDGNTVPIVGYIDVVQDDLNSDYKVVKRTKSQADVDSSLQMAVYGVATENKRAENICLCKTKTPKVVRVETQLSEQAGLWAAEVFRSVAQAVSKGAFPCCNPADWCCSEKFCGYWHLCRGKKG